MTRKKTYHHGDLRQALLQAALEMIEETGFEGLSLRKIAARVGVSHAAPEHHFPTLKHLLNAMVTEGFSLFTQSMATERRNAPPEPVEQMRAAVRGYLAHASARPQLFRLMFTSNLLDWSDPALIAASADGYQQLREICAPAADKLNLRSDADRTGLEHLVWSQVHGQAQLMIDNKLIDHETGEPCPVPDHPIDLAGLLFGG
jgi:AcrR family transcriptional regulator